MSQLFSVFNEDEQANSLARKLPDGDCFVAKYIEDCNIRLWLLALAQELIRVNDYMNYVHEEMQLTNTTDLIVDFEKDYGMNSNCFSSLTGQTLEQRINNILTLILSKGTSTEEQFEELGALMGFDIDVSSNSFTAPNLVNDRFVIYVRINATAPVQNVFPFTFPFPFGSGTSEQSLLECFFNVLKPAHTIIDFSYTN